jgi:tetratricopeptide (TPR) repeat protein
MKSMAYRGSFLLLIVALAAPGWAQTNENPWGSSQEYDAYNEAWKQPDNAKKGALFEKFLTDFKNSKQRTAAYQIMILAYAQGGVFAKALEYADRVKEFVPTPDAALMGSVNAVGFVSAQALKNTPKTIEYGERMLAANPKNLDALVTLSGIYSSSFPPDPAARDKQIATALDLTKRALAEPKPDKVNDAQWKQVQVQLLVTVCALTYNKRQYPETIAACDQVLKVERKEARAWYYTGLAHKYLVPDLQKKYVAAVDEYNIHIKTPNADPITSADLKARSDETLRVVEAKVQEAIDAFGNSVAIGGVPEARKELDDLWMSKNKSLEGLDAFIAQRKAQFQ